MSKGAQVRRCTGTGRGRHPRRVLLPTAPSPQWLPVTGLTPLMTGPGQGHPGIAAPARSGFDLGRGVRCDPGTPARLPLPSGLLCHAR